MEWRSHQPKSKHVTTAEFQSLMDENHRAAAIRFVLDERPTLKNIS
jgi:hypothetical protein